MGEIGTEYTPLYELMVFRGVKEREVEDKLVDFERLITEGGGFVNGVSNNIRDVDGGVSGTALISFEMPVPEE